MRIAIFTLGSRMTHSSTVALADRAVESTKGQELIVAHNLSMLGLLAAEANRIPYVTGHLFTSLIASSSYWLTGKNYGKPINRLMWFLAQRFLAPRVDRYYADLFRRFGVATRRNMLMRAGHSALLNLVAISPHVLPAALTRELVSAFSDRRCRVVLQAG